MTKLLALCLVLSALLMAGHCTQANLEGDVIVKDGHRVIVVEYDGDGKTNTKVLISPPEKEERRRDEGNGKNKVRETEEERDKHHASPGELIDICKQKMATVLWRVKDLTVSPDVEEKLAHEAHYAEEKVAEQACEAKEEVHEEAVNKAQNAWHRAKILARGLGTAVAAELKIAKIGSVVGLIGISAAYGTCVWVMLVSSYVLSSVLGRQQLGVVKSRLHPVYFKATFLGILVGLLGHIISRRRKVFTDAVDMWHTVNLLSSILVVEANASFVEPRATKTMFERMKVEKEEGRGRDPFESQSSEAVAWTSRKQVTKKMDEDEDPIKQKLTNLNEKLSRFHAYSYRLNLLTLMSLTWHFVYLGHRLSFTC